MFPSLTKWLSALLESGGKSTQPTHRSASAVTSWRGRGSTSVTTVVYAETSMPADTVFSIPPDTEQRFLSLQANVKIGGSSLRRNECRSCGLHEKEHAPDGKCLFEATTYLSPLEEQWIYDMATAKTYGILCLTSPSGKVLEFAIELGEFSSTEGIPVPYFEFKLNGATKIT